MANRVIKSLGKHAASGGAIGLGLAHINSMATASANAAAGVTGSVDALSPMLPTGAGLALGTGIGLGIGIAKRHKEYKAERAAHAALNENQFGKK